MEFLIIAIVTLVLLAGVATLVATQRRKELPPTAPWFLGALPGECGTESYGCRCGDCRPVGG